MDDSDLNDAAHKAWLYGGVAAFKSLEEEIRANERDTGEILLSDTSGEGADLLLEILKAAPDENKVLMTACRLAAAALRADDRRTTLDMRMLYRQAVMAAGFFFGKPEDAQYLAVNLEDALLLNPQSSRRRDTSRSREASLRGLMQN
jgi:hypothetical protein